MISYQPRSYLRRERICPRTARNGTKYFFRLFSVFRGHNHLPDLYDVIKKRSVDLFEPVRRALRNDDDIALLKLSGFAAVDTRSAEFILRDELWIDGLTARDKCRVAVENINDVRVEFVDLAHSGFFTSAGVDHIVFAVRSAFENGTSGESI